MAWFKVDDKFYDHVKVDELAHSAVGLWLLCGTWSASKEQDGKVPTRIIRKFKGARRDVEALAGAGLWLPNGDGFVMHDFLDYNPSRLELEQRRQRERERYATRLRDEHGRYL